jgi:hypothetical protein
MGTSQSNPGSPGGVPLVPPWVPSPDDDYLDDSQISDTLPYMDDDGKNQLPMQSYIPIASDFRFAGARRSLGSFVKSGSDNDLKRSLRNYVQKGLGGIRMATRRFEGTVRTADMLYRTLTSMGQGQTVGSPLDPALFAGRSAQEIIDAVIEAVGPVNGTLDGESSRESRKEAFSELLNRYQNANLFLLSDEERFCVIEQFIASDVFHRFDLDVGKAILNKAPNPIIGLSRRKQIRNYIKQEVARAFRQMHKDGLRPSAGRISGIVRNALERVFRIFEGFVL